MYRNLEAEMIRSGVTRSDVSELLGIGYAAVIYRISGKKRFYWDEVLKIQTTYFPKIDIKYLFEVHECVA